MNRKEAITFVFILGVLLVVSGVDECAQGFGGGTTEAAKYGVDFALQSGLGRLSEGKTVVLGEPFIVDMLIENFDSEQKTGEICIRDDIEDLYGGVPSMCRQFSIPGATYIGDTLESPATLEMIFPESGSYKYEGYKVDTDVKLYASISYAQSSAASAIIKAPLPEQETITFTQKPSPVIVSAEKTITNREDSVNLNLKIKLEKQGNYNVTSRDFKREAIAISSDFGYNLDCPDISQGFIDFKSTKFISCSALLPREQTSHALIIYLDYGVKLSKPFNFKLKIGA